MPPITPENAQPWMWAMLRLSDGILLVLDAGDDDVLEHAENLIAFMEDNSVRLKNEGDLLKSGPSALRISAICLVPKPGLSCYAM